MSRAGSARDLPAPDTAPGAAVIGAGGFVGARLVAALEAAGVPTERFTRSRPFLRDGELAPGLRGAPILFYFATSVTPGSAESHPELVEADYELFDRLLGGLRRAGGDTAVVLASSGTVYDPRIEPPYDEAAPTWAPGAYGAGKLRMERALLDQAGRLRPLVIRLASMYGSGARTAPGFGVIPHWLRAAGAGRPVDLIGDPEVRRDFVYIDDVLDAMLRVHAAMSAPAGARGALPPILNIGSGAPTSLTELLREVSTVTGRELVVRRQDGRGFDRKALWLDVRRAADNLGWRPRTSLAEGLTQTWHAIGEEAG